jgi:ATP-dependent RNA helicase RhlE
MPFTQLGLLDKLVQGILATGYTAPTQIQAQAIPAALSGKDIIGRAQTGTGKTAAFVLPMLQKLAATPVPGRRHVRALVLTPTRELAQQVEAALRQYGRFIPLTSCAVYGGVGMQPQIDKLRHGVDIIIATPGRLLDHLGRHNTDLSRVEVLVLDEADRMLDMGFIIDVRRIIDRLPRTRQTMLFSATVSAEIRSLANDILRNPLLIEIGQLRDPVATVRQTFYMVAQPQKQDLLHFLLAKKEMDCVLVFTRTKHRADAIVRKLEARGFKAVAIHSNRTQSQREKALAGFKAGRYRVMVATDIAARGIDVTGISHVINYDIPGFPEDYIHRIGRTGRAEATGDAVTFVSSDERDEFSRIARFIGRQIELKRCPDFTYTMDPDPPTFRAGTVAAGGPATPPKPGFYHRRKRDNTRRFW